MNICKTCKHWNFDEDDWQFNEIGFGKCAAIRQREDIIDPIREQQWEDWDEREKEELNVLREAKAVAVDRSGYYAAVRTAPDFGCTLHEERE